MTTLAITGAAGFVGKALVAQALVAGHIVHALTRRPQPPREGIVWLDGALDRPDSLAALADGADAIVHVAGVVNAANRAGFVAGNIDGTRAMLDAARAAGVRRFVHVSSLSAREPRLSNYGWSKAEAETLVAASGLDWSIVRPSGVYGPGDMEMRDLFRAARFGIALLPPRGAVSLVAVEDLARLLLTLATQAVPPAIYEVDDGHILTHDAMAQAIGRAVGRRRVLALHLPRAALMLGARLDKTLRGRGAKLTADRVGYLSHPDWTARPALRPPAALWTPAIAPDEGLAATARWYRDNGLL
ncbi:NAD(P)-dependent oxidoreductase [Sphingomonas sp. RP10(2022)]|uniref:NAD(P)-dependent oxidoreductase n=1 Tax=Sphingomonas liriopis TaxID=2949094 RepID=A0A9X2HSE2_9SPHN|nr:NAD(P)-dependent oxidoreductase [Sphingomonas liriopis]MCP3734594.1 NAD(P)-dependent oxidoreductase [Sphingomonas liriopis]